MEEPEPPPPAVVEEVPVKLKTDESEEEEGEEFVVDVDSNWCWAMNAFRGKEEDDESALPTPPLLLLLLMLLLLLLIHRTSPPEVTMAARSIILSFSTFSLSRMKNDESCQIEISDKLQTNSITVTSTTIPSSTSGLHVWERERREWTLNHKSGPSSPTSHSQTSHSSSPIATTAATPTSNTTLSSNHHLLKNITRANYDAIYSHLIDGRKLTQPLPLPFVMDVVIHGWRKEGFYDYPPAVPVPPPVSAPAPAPAPDAGDGDGNGNAATVGASSTNPPPPAC